MSIDMFLTNSYSQATSFHTGSISRIRQYQLLSETITSFATTNFGLSGKAYDSARIYFFTILLPIVNAGKLLSELSDKACSKLPSDFSQEVFNGDLKESELEDGINNCIYQINELEELINDERASDHPSYNYIRSLRNSQDIWIEEKIRLEDLLQKLRTFDNSSKNMFDEFEFLKNNLTQAISEVEKQVTFNPYTKMFDLGNLKKIDSIIILKVLYEENVFSPTEIQFRENLQKQYGFDIETAHIIVKVRKGIDSKFPSLSEKDKSYLFNLLMSKSVYDNFKWDHTSGDFKYFFLDEGKKPTLEYIYNQLGISSYDYSKVAYKISLQNRMSGAQLYPSKEFYSSAADELPKELKNAQNYFGKDNITEDEFCKIWDTYNQSCYGKIDFAHMSATIATLQNPEQFRLANGVGLLNYKGFSNKFVNELAGWRGDATDQAAASPSLGNDDYKADLDADNIFNIYTHSSSDYFTVVNKYYSDIENKTLNRAEEFTKNNGLEYIQNEILKASMYISKAPLLRQDFSNPGIHDFSTVTFTIPTMDELKNLNPVGYNFIKNLENHNNDLTDYISEENP